jgi:thioredoxin 1
MMSDITFNDANFETDVIKAPELVLVDFFAVWCGPCKILAPILDKLALAYSGKVKIGKLDVEENEQTVTRYEISHMPTLIFFKKGEMVERLVGFQSEEALKKKIEELL